jgi:hypothetical protein
MSEDTRAVRRLSRRRALALGGGVVGGAILGGPVTSPAARARPLAKGGKLPVSKIEQIVGVEGSVSGGILDIAVSRDDLGHVSGPLGVTFTPEFELDGDLVFQPLRGGQAFLNGDLALLPGEIQPVIDALIANGLVFQAFHQHLYDLDPMVWFIHLRGLGDPLALARACRAALDVTATPLPQTPPPPATPLQAHRLATILHGSFDVSAEVVTVTVPRRHGVVIDGVHVDPDTNIETNIQFRPLDSSGSTAAVVPDFSMDADEVMPVTALMRRLGWLDGCLYNQETDEKPQLYFSHMLKVGDPYDLAAEIRAGLDLTDAE